MSAVRRRRAALAALVAILLGAVALGGLLGTSGAGAVGGELVVQPSLGAPTSIFLGASPGEAPGEVWATAKGNRTLARYTDAGGWEVLPEPEASGGGPIPNLILAFSASAGRTTPAGGVAVAGEVEDEFGERQGVLLTRDPGGSLRETPSPQALLGGEELFGGVNGSFLLAAAEEAGGKTGAYVVPGGLESVLFFDGGSWSEEPICIEAAPLCVPPEAGFQVSAIAAGEGQAWLLGSGEAGAGLELFRRQLVSGQPLWLRQRLGPPGSLGARFAEAEPLSVLVAPRGAGQPLTVTASGVWADATLDDGSAHEATVYYDVGKGEITGSWCDLGSAPFCTFPLGAELPSGQGRSFAWPPAGPSEPFGTRAITGVGQGAILTLGGTGFQRQTFVGGEAGSKEGAALSSPEEGWLGATPPLQLTRSQQAARLQAWPLPFKRPLAAVAPQPGAPVGSLSSEALAVGDEGQVARYLPGIGWEAEFLLRSSGRRATPTLRGVAWPEPDFAYAVGDGAAMWRWQKATGLWQPDPGAPPNLARANFTGIAFDPGEPTRGYAIGKQGLLLGFGRQWTQEALPAGVPPEANLTSIAFAGDEALVTYKYLERDAGNNIRPKGGVLVNDGSGWRAEPAATEALKGAIPQRVAGLPDGGAAIASLNRNEGGQSAAGVVLERQGAGAAWEPAAGGSIGYPTALAAIRENGRVQAIASVAPVQGQPQGDVELAADREQVESQPPPGQAPLLTAPYKLPSAGLVVRQTPTGWRDEEREGFPLPAKQGASQDLFDLPVRPDPVLALLIAPDGSGGWAVGGETGTAIKFRSATAKTASVLRYGSGAAPPQNASSSSLGLPAGTATFAFGGNARCSAPCADMAGAGIGPDRWLHAAVSRASATAGVRAFLYAGGSVAETDGELDGETPLALQITPQDFQREENAYARRASSSSGATPVYAAPAQSDLDAAGSLGSFLSAFSGFAGPLGGAPAPAGIALRAQPGLGGGYYSFDSSGSGGAVRVVVLDYSRPSLGEGQRCWLAQELSAARLEGRPALVVGSRDLANLAPGAAADRSQVVQTLVGLSGPEGCALPGPAASASAYLFDFPEQNRDYRLTAGGRSIPAYGSGTLGYVTPPAPTNKEFAGASGFLLISVDAAAADPTTNVAPVGAQLVPSIGSLALEASDGTLLRRSQPALFQGLARRPLGGSRCQSSSGAAECELLSPEPYVPIPSHCLGSNCASSLFPEYTFASSEPDIADFVAPEPGSSNPRNVLLVKGKPVLDPHSGLLCAFNAGSTTVTVAAGGLSYSLKVAVQPGTVQRPCGTTPLRNRGTPNASPEAPPAPAPTPEGSPLPNETPPPPPPPPVSSPVPAAAPAAIPAKPAPPPPAPPTYFPLPAPASAALVPILPPPPLPAVQPTPPSGTSQVQAVEREEEEEEAIESVSSMAALPSRGPARVAPVATATPASNPLGSSFSQPAILVVAALAAATIGGGLRRRRPRPALATVNRNRRYR